MSATAYETINVSSAAELMAALENAQGGETILLAAGNYGELNLNSNAQAFAQFAGEVTIKSAHPDDVAVFDRLVLNGVSNLTFDNIRVELTPFDNMPRWYSAVDIDDSSNLKFLNSEFEGGLALDDTDGSKEGYATGRAIDIVNSHDIWIESSEISVFFDGVVVANVDGLTLTNNEIHHLRTTPVRGSGIDNLLMDGNHLHDSTPWGWGEPGGDHGDYVHFWLTEGQSGDNLVFVNNVMEQGDGTALLGIFLEGEHGTGYTNVVIENNVLINDHHLGIYLENVDGAIVRNNTLMHHSDEQVNGPSVYMSIGTKNVLLTDNVISSAVSHSLSEEDAATITQSNNLLVQRSSPDSPNYVGDVFVNALVENPSLSDVLMIPGGPGEQLNVGSSLTRFDTTPEDATGYITSDAGNGMELLTHSLDASALYGPDGPLDLSGATVAWDFGDGNSGTGLTGNHTWQQAGTYAVTALVTLADGQTVSLGKTVAVQTPLAIHATFDIGAGDLSDITNDVVVGSAVTYEGAGDDLALRLNQDNVAYKRNAELVNNSEYTLQVDFKKDAGSEGTSGTLVYFSSSFVVNIAADGLNVMVGTDQGNIWLQPTGVGINDSDWHRLALTFSGADGAAILYLDGVEVARATGLDGATQTGSAFHDLFLGNPFDGASSFTGLIDNVQFWKGAMSGAEIEALSTPTEDGSFAPLDGTSTQTDPVDDGSSDPVVDGEAEPTAEDTTLDFSDTSFDQVIIGTDGDDKLSGGKGADYIDGAGGNDTLRGQNGADVLLAGDGNDQLYGGNDNDILVGGGGTNLLDGGNGNDLLISGSGVDVMTGGRGSDTFMFRSIANSAPGGGDSITDFSQGEDKIDVSVIDAIAGGGNDAFVFIGSDAFSAAGQLRQFDFGGGIMVEGDIDGDGNADFQIALLTPGLVLTSDDFVA